MATEVKPKSNRILLIFGVFLAIVAFGGALLVGRTSGGTPGAIGGGAKNVDVVVATQEIAASTQITAALVTITKFSEDTVPPFAFRDKNLVIGKYAAIPIHANAAIIDTDIVSDAGSVTPTKQAFLKIPPGQVAMQIPTGELVGAGGYIQPDDRIDILVTYSVNGKSLTKVTFTNLHIIRVGPAGGPNARGISSSLTVIVTLQQAQDLKWLLDNTNYKYVLKSVDDYDHVDSDTSSTTSDSFAKSYNLR
ncbi:MAG TPA: Flp pilus assembly protein CpaB [Candidatus Dormibacteraeota bacterium]|nr:Flp pilus assembly protein CpaB [Candidatus Dormibacteraeota bacterium]